MQRSRTKPNVRYTRTKMTWQVTQMRLPLQPALSPPAARVLDRMDLSFYSSGRGPIPYPTPRAPRPPEIARACDTHQCAPQSTCCKLQTQLHTGGWLAPFISTLAPSHAQPPSCPWPPPPRARVARPLPSSVACTPLVAGLAAHCIALHAHAHTVLRRPARALPEWAKPAARPMSHHLLLHAAACPLEPFPAANVAASACPPAFAHVPAGLAVLRLPAGPAAQREIDPTHRPAIDLPITPTIDPTHRPAIDLPITLPIDPTIDLTIDPTIDLTIDLPIGPPIDLPQPLPLMHGALMPALMSTNPRDGSAIGFSVLRLVSALSGSRLGDANDGGSATNLGVAARMLSLASCGLEQMSDTDLLRVAEAAAAASSGVLHAMAMLHAPLAAPAAVLRDSPGSASAWWRCCVGHWLGERSAQSGAQCVRCLRLSMRALPAAVRLRLRGGPG